MAWWLNLQGIEDMGAIDPDVQILLDALEARISALEAAPPSNVTTITEIVHTHDDGTVSTFPKAP